MTVDHPGFIIPPGAAQGRILNIFGQTVTERISGEDSGGACYVFDEITPPGLGVPPHRHAAEDEVARINAGIFEVFVNGTVSRAGPGSLLNFMRGSLHGFRCVGDSPGETTWFVTPGLSFMTFFRAVAAFPPGPPDFAALDALNARHGMTMAPPGDPWW